VSQESRFCHRCGASLPTGSAFCPRCGAPVALSQPGSPAPATTQVPPPSDSAAPRPKWEGRYEKQEKHEKHEKGEKGEKAEKGRGGDLAGALTGGLILILLGVLFYLSQVGTYAIDWSNFWEYLLIGIGAILVIQGAIRYAQLRRAYPGSFIGGAVLIIIGSVFLTNAGYVFWPLILVVIGMAVILSAFVGRNRMPRP
jgi:ribosomal protein S27AE